jgi:hypothetical protein
MRRVVLLCLSALVLALAAGVETALAQTPQCAKGDFEAVVDEAAAALRALNQQHTPQFQVRLRQLKEKRGWSNDQFLKEAEPYVRDEQMAGYDRKSEEFLARITSGGQAASAGGPPDCSVLLELRAALKALVDTQKEKWAYMFAKIDAELKK